jgi:hypothetical protein
MFYSVQNFDRDCGITPALVLRSWLQRSAWLLASGDTPLHHAH